jgi:hypothetical protein
VERAREVPADVMGEGSVRFQTHCNNFTSFDKSSSAQSLTLNIITLLKNRSDFLAEPHCSFIQYITYLHRVSHICLTLNTHMKKLLLLVIILPLAVFSQEKNSTGGTYRFGNDIEKENIGEILIKPTTSNKALLYITASKSAPSYNTSVLLTEIEINDNKAYYQSKAGSGVLAIEFHENSLTISDTNHTVSRHVFLKNTAFQKIDSSIPESFSRGNGKSVKINKTATEYRRNYYKNNTIWDFIGVWNYGQNTETLNISKGTSSDEISIQYNSNKDGYEDRFFENCQYKEGKIYGSFYGGKGNVLLEIEEGVLLLTIDPFHQFNPIKSRGFKRSGGYIFKYNSSNEVAYLFDQPSIKSVETDSLPPGDRVLIFNEDRNDIFFRTKYHAKRYHKELVENENLYVSKTHFSDTKPLFSKNVQLKGFPNLNKGELFVQRLYSPTEREKNTVIVPNIGAEQNVPGQKKLLINQEIFEELNLQLIGREFDKNYLKVYITGTIDLDPIVNSLVTDFQYENEYYTYLINYDQEGKYIDHILIGRNDYVESMTPIKSFFAPGEIYVNSLLQHWVEDGVDVGSSYYQTFETVRYVINQKGQLIASNYASSNKHEQELSLKVLSQPVESNGYGKATLSLFLNYSDTASAGGYVTNLSTKIDTENGMNLTIPIDLSPVCGFHHPPFGNFQVPFGELQKLFYTNKYDGVNVQLSIKFNLRDINNDGVDELFMEMTDKSYAVAPSEYFCFIYEAGTWVYSEFNEAANVYIDDLRMPYEKVFAAYYKTGLPPNSIPVDADKKQELLLKSNENLIYGFQLKNKGKRVCIGVDEKLKYVVYRFGISDNIEFEYRVDYNSDANKFNYYKEDQTLVPPRDYLEHIRFNNEDFEYAVFNNYVESELQKAPNIPVNNGVGIRVRNMKTGEISILEANESTIEGVLGLTMLCIK